MGKSPWRRNSNPLQYFCLENPMVGFSERLHFHFSLSMESPQSNMSKRGCISMRAPKGKWSIRSSSLSYDLDMCMCVKVKAKVAQLCPTLCDPMDCSFIGFYVHGDSPGKKTGGGSHSFLHRVFSTQGSNLGLPHGRQILYCLSHRGNPRSSLKSFYI